MKGYRTLAINGAAAALFGLGHWALGVNWDTYVDPSTAVIILAGINGFMRFLTDTKVGEDK